MEATNLNTPIVIFDGECNLCNGVVDKLTRTIPNERVSWVPFQSSLGQHLLRENGLSTIEMDSVILFERDAISKDSDAFFKLIAQVPRFKWTALACLSIPKGIRDGIYKVFARNRVAWFGKSQSCSLGW
ncbi:MAG: DUF393 domain-containing protein [Bacteroidota bacterium]